MRGIHSQRGISLIEMLVALALLGTVMSISGTALFQSLTQTKQQGANITSAHDVRNAAAWVVRDGQMAQTTSLVDGAPPVSSLTLSWTDQSVEGGVSHTVTYDLSGNSLIRTYDGYAIIVAHHVSSVGFSLSGQTIFFTITSQGDGGKAIQKTYQTYMRSTG